MRKITKKAVSAFMNRARMTSGNTSVDVEPWVCFGEGEFLTVKMRLHGNTIAEAEYSADQKRFTQLKVTHCNWQTPTTKERLNGILDAFDLPGIYQRDGVWYYTDGNTFLKVILSISTVNQPWPYCHIDWDAAADALKIDYSSCEYQGETYWFRG